MDFETATSDLDILLGDSANTTFTTDEKERALTKAWNDSFVVNTVWDDSLTYTQGTYQYALPETITTIKDVYLSVVGSTDPMPEPIDNSLWELIDGNIQFNQKADNIIPTGYTLYLKGNYKLTTEDELERANLQEYVLSLAGYTTLTLLGHKKANLFLKNDTTMGELIAFRRELNQDVADLRRKLAKEWESA